MEELVLHFLDFLKNDKRLSLNTLQSYKRDIEQYITYLKDMKIQNIANTNKTTVIAYLLHLQKRAGRLPPYPQPCINKVVLSILNQKG